MLRYKTETRAGLVALYDMRPGNGAGQFLQPRSPHGAHYRWFWRPSLSTNWRGVQPGASMHGCNCKAPQAHSPLHSSSAVCEYMHRLGSLKRTSCQFIQASLYKHTIHSLTWCLRWDILYNCGWGGVSGGDRGGDCIVVGRAENRRRRRIISRLWKQNATLNQTD